MPKPRPTSSRTKPKIRPTLRVELTTPLAFSATLMCFLTPSAQPKCFLNYRQGHRRQPIATLQLVPLDPSHLFRVAGAAQRAAGDVAYKINQDIVEANPLRGLVRD